jgi:TPR repeat protein
VKKCAIAFIVCLLLDFRGRAQSSTTNQLSESQRERLVLEEKHFVECLGYVYRPAFWISYKDGLYFAPKTEAQAQQIESLKTARAGYVILTNREARYDLAAEVIAESGIDPNWQRRILLPYSDTNQNLTPTLQKTLSIVNGYKVLRSFPDGDAIIEAQGGLGLVMNCFCPTNSTNTSEAWLIKEGEKAYATAPGEYQRVDAFTRVELSPEETAVLNGVVAACQKRAAALSREIAGFGARQAFANSVLRATDSNPSLQYQIAKAYLEGKGTEKDEKLGLEWMNKAARNGSGDAKSYLEASGGKTP